MSNTKQVEEHKTLLRKQCLLSRDRIFMRMGGMLTRAQPVSAVPNPGPSHVANAGGAFVRRGQRPLPGLLSNRTRRCPGENSPDRNIFDLKLQSIELAAHHMGLLTRAK